MAITLSRTPTSGTAPVAVAFTANPVPTAPYIWDFGDGSTSTTETAPTHVYVKTGTFTISLRTSTDSGTTTVTVSAIAAPSGVMTTKVWIDFDSNGTFSTGGTHNDDVTAYVRSINIERGAQFDLLGGQSPGKATLVVKNTDGRWNDRNASGAYYGVLRPGLRVWIGMTDGASHSYGLFAGYLDEIAPIPGGSMDAQLIVTDPFGYWQTQPIEVVFAENRSVGEFRAAILDSLGVTTANRFLDDETDGLAASGVRADNALAVLEELNKSVVTRHWIEPASDRDNFYFYCTLGRNRNLGTEYAADLSQNDIVAMDGYRSTRESIVNFLNVTYTPITWMTQVQPALWKAEGPVAMPIGVTRLVVRFSSWVKGLVVSCTFDDATDASVTVTNYGKEAVITLTDNVRANTAKGLKLRGYTVNAESFEPIYEAKDTASQTSYGKKAGASVSGDYIQTSAIAQAVGDSVVARSKSPRTRPSVRFKNKYTKFLPNRLHSVVRQTLSELSLSNEQYEVVGLSARIDEGDTVHEFSWTYLGTTIATAGSVALFTIDTSQVGGTDVLGF